MAIYWDLLHIGYGITKMDSCLNIFGVELGDGVGNMDYWNFDNFGMD